MLFIIFINDLLARLSCLALAYADDFKLYLRIRRIADLELLQSSLELVNVWCSRNGLILNIQKCFKLTFTRSLRPLTFNYSIGNCLIASGDRFRDLGVLFDSTFSFVPHIEELCSSASRSLGYVFRCSREFPDVSVLRIFYFSLVVSKLEYANLVWFPIYSSHLTSLERIHRKFLKCAEYRKTGRYPERGADLSEIMREMRVSTLQERQKQQCAKFAQKLVTGRIDSPHLLSRVDIRVPRIEARTTSTFRLPKPRTNILEQALVYRLCRAADELKFNLFFLVRGGYCLLLYH